MADVENVKNQGNTPAVIINLHDKDKDPVLWKGANEFEGKDGKAYVFAHGSDDGKHIYDQRNGNSKAMGWHNVGYLLKQHGVSTETPIMLVSCSAGRGANSLARELSGDFIQVEAFTRTLRTPSSRIIKSYLLPDDFELMTFDIQPRNEEELLESSTIDDGDGKNPGILKTFKREDYDACMKNAKQCDDPASEQPKDQSTVIEPLSKKTETINPDWPRKLQEIVGSLPIEQQPLVIAQIEENISKTETSHKQNTHKSFENSISTGLYQS